jgi:hypothetical protein
MGQAKGIEQPLLRHVKGQKKTSYRGKSEAVFKSKDSIGKYGFSEVMKIYRKIASWKEGLNIKVNKRDNKRR